ncbi:septin-7-like isoform X2 [Symphalangus syndactylus]|uniref:septin-7-like isoform X2 n=1 Tax=Symphalangus syndactylus TaxID=9590 RepID=UPI00244283F5|nr:septin-7-like isoform X2 [Symphalangus syndactylus]
MLLDLGQGYINPSLKPLDIEFMKRLHEKVNIIPLIAKADTLTPEECQQFKKQTSWLVIGAAAMKTSDMPWRHFPHCLGKKKCQKKLRDQKPGPLQLRRHPAG